MYINNLGHMTKMAAMPIYGKNPLKCHLKGKPARAKKLANEQNIDYSEKRKHRKGFICPCTGVKYHNIQTCLLVYAADSGERLQDHWSSGLKVPAIKERNRNRGLVTNGKCWETAFEKTTDGEDVAGSVYHSSV